MLRKLIAALGVVVLDRKIQAFLKENDPKCLDQCLQALRDCGDPQAEITVNRYDALESGQGNGGIIPALPTRNN